MKLIIIFLLLILIGMVGDIKKQNRQTHSHMEIQTEAAQWILNAKPECPQDTN